MVESLLTAFSPSFLGLPLDILLSKIEYMHIYFKILTGKPTGKIPLGRPRRRWEENIRIDLEEIGINAGNWVDSTQDRYIREPL